MGFKVTYDALGTPLVVVTGPLPEVTPPGAEWCVLHGDGNPPTDGYFDVFGVASGTPETGLTWKVVTMWSGDQEKGVSTGNWGVTAAMFDVDCRFMGHLATSRTEDGYWHVEVPPFPAGPKRLALVSVVARRPHVKSYLRTPVLLLVGAA